LSDPPQTKASRPERPPLAREFIRFLLELSVGVHRHAIYPPGHPSLEPVAEEATSRLTELLSDRPVLRIGVARQELLAEGGASDPRQPVLADLARRLHYQQIAGISFTAGVEPGEVEALLATLGRAQEADAVPLGLLDAEDLPTWPHVRIHPLGVDRLLQGEEEWDGARAVDLWMGLAGTILGQEAADHKAARDPRRLAAALAGRSDDAGLRAQVSDQVAELVAELRATSGAEAEQIRGRVTELLAALEPEILDRIVAMGGDPEARQRFLHDMNHALPVDAVFHILESAARSQDQNISHALSRLLSKLSTHAANEDDPDAQEVSGWAPGGAGLRDLVDRLLDDWVLEDPNPEGYTAVLDAMARAVPAFRERTEADAAAGETLAGPLRVVQTALEVGAFGTTVKRALLDLVDCGEAGPVIELLAADVAIEPVAGVMLDFLTEPGQLRRILLRSEVEERALDALVGQVGEGAIDPLMEVLVESESRSLRRKVFDMLARLGPRAAQRAVEGLEDARWYVQRNMLALLHHLEGLPPGFDPLWFVSHGDHRVRREAFPLALRDASSRDHALSLALSDRDERLVRMALLELRDGVPDALVPTTVSRAMHESRSDEIRALAVRTVRDNESVLVRDALLALAAPSRSFFGRPRLAAPTPAAVAAIEVLARAWSAEPAVRAVLDRARKSHDPDFVRAAGESP
jgi:hypothetical protein